MPIRELAEGKRPPSTQLSELPWSESVFLQIESPSTAIRR